MFTSWCWLKFDFTNTGQIGDTIGGIMGPFIAVAAAILTFLAFWVQFKANEIQRQDIKLERFENKFYESIQLHKSNLNEINIADKLHGRKCFVHMFYELKFAYHKVEEVLNKINDSAGNKYDNVNIMSLAYRIFFFGIGTHSEKNYYPYLNTEEKSVFNKLKPELEIIQNNVLKYFGNDPWKKGYYTFESSGKTKSKNEGIEFFYYPFDGHANRLGHYYRHLFQTTNHVVSQDFLNDDEKYIYIKTLRAQLSNYEQLLLYYNALAWSDVHWRVIMTKFRFIKNLPLGLADFHEKPEEHFKSEINALRSKGIEIFEWLE